MIELNLPLPAPGEPTVFDTAEDAVFNYSNLHVKSVLCPFLKSDDLIKKMAAWYRFVRDEIRYDPFAVELEAEALSASRTVQAQHGHCLHKSVLFVSGLRAMGVPARLGLARVRNHLATERLEYLDDYGLHTAVPLNFLKEALQREYPHCFIEVGQWRLPQA